ncbi:hypothetical protein ACWCV9_01305 [Streptomyces sp. NPDC001606]
MAAASVRSYGSTLDRDARSSALPAAPRSAAARGALLLAAPAERLHEVDDIGGLRRLRLTDDLLALPFGYPL